MTASQYDVPVDLRYVDDGGAYLNEIEEGSSLSKGQLGEKIAARQMRRYLNRVTDGNADAHVFKGYDGTVSANGPDLVYRDPKTDEIVVVEVKFLSDSGNFGVGNLGKADGNYQLSDGWIEYIYRDEVGIDKETADKIKNAYLRGNLRREANVIQNRPKDGYTIAKSISDLGVDKVTISKVGKQR